MRSGVHLQGCGDALLHAALAHPHWSPTARGMTARKAIRRCGHRPFPLLLLLTRRMACCRTAFPGMRVLLCHYHLKRALHNFLLKKVICWQRGSLRASNTLQHMARDVKHLRRQRR
jgi:hypothetical protein